jgi:serine/threonine protein phosphatase PrpC
VQALHAAFVECDAECQRRFKSSGTTATLAVAVGWELLVASVGDSCAYLDTGAEVIQVRTFNLFNLSVYLI